MRNLTLRQMRAVIAVARHGKVVAAAAELGLTAPAVTLQLAQVEAEAGLSLFDRTPAGMRLTSAGGAVLDTALAVEERLRALRDDIDAIKGVRLGSLRLGVVSTAKYFAPGLMAAFMRVFPEIEMKLLVGNRAETIERLRAHVLDIALMGRPPADIPVRASVFGDHPLVIVAPPGHLLTGERDIAKETLARETFLIRERGSGTRISLEIFMSDVAGWHEEPGLEMDSNETIKQAVMAGLGIAFISAHTVASELETGRLVMLDVADLPIRRQWFSVSRADRAMTPAMTAFQDYLLGKGATHLPVLGRL